MVMIKVFIQNEAGSDQKHFHDEKTLEYKRTITVSRPYPFPYGFILNTTSEDGDNLDCYVITEQSLKTGMLVECEPIALLEQIEDGDEDHNVPGYSTRRSSRDRPGHDGYIPRVYPACL